MSRTPRKPVDDTIYLRDTREKNWFWLNNELVDVFAPLVGPYAFAVYVCLAHGCKGNSPYTTITIRQIEKLWRSEFVVSAGRAALSRSSISRAISQLIAAGMVEIVEKASRNDPTVYALPSLAKLAARLTPELAEKLAVRLEQMRGRGVEPAAPCVPVGDTTHPPQNLSKSCAKASVKPPFSTEVPGTGVSPTRPLESPTGDSLLLIQEEEINTLPPTPLREGGAVCVSQPHGGNTPDGVRFRQRWHVAAQAVRNHLWAARAGNRGKGGQRLSGLDGSEDWMLCFASVALDRVDLVDGGRLQLTVTSADPRSTIDGFRKYRSTWHAALEGAFGHVPEIVTLSAKGASQCA